MMRGLDGNFQAERPQHAGDGIEAGLCFGTKCLVQCLTGDSTVTGDVTHATRFGDITESSRE